MEREYGKQMIDIFREIKDKICDIQCSSMNVNNSKEQVIKQKNQDENAQQKM